MNSYKNSLELSNKFQKCLRICADMLDSPDEKKEKIYGFRPGLQKTFDAAVLREQLRNLKEGIFQVMFTGGFDAGKSTLINALMHKDLLKTSIRPETAVITKIIFGQEEAAVIIFKKISDEESGQAITERMSVEDFFEYYRVSQDNPEKFSDVDYVVIEQPNESIGGTLVQLVDSPGTGNSKPDDNTAKSFAEKANAIIYLLNSTRAFEIEEKEYIASHFDNKHVQNVFFVFNWFNALDDVEQENLKNHAKVLLENVFTDNEGNFNEELYNQRVFYINAKGSLFNRIGKTAKACCSDNETGVPEFEAALSEYLTSGDRNKEAFRGYLPQLATKYLAACEEIKKLLKAYENGKGKCKADKKDLESKKQRLESIMTQIKQSCSTCVTQIVNSTKTEYSSTMNRIDKGWDSKFQNTDIPFGITGMIGLAWNRTNDASVRKITKPFTNAVQKYVFDEFDKMSENLTHLVEAQLNILDGQLASITAQLGELKLPISVESLREALIQIILEYKPENTEPIDVNKANLFQILLGLAFFDIDIAVQGLGGNTSNIKAITQSILKNFFEATIYIVAWPLRLAMVAARIWDIIRGVNQARDQTAAQILMSMREGVVKTLVCGKEKYIMEFEKRLSSLIRAGKTMSDALRSQVDDYEATIENIILQLKEKTSTLASERERTDKIKEAMLTSISEVNFALNGRNLDEAEISQLAIGG